MFSFYFYKIDIIRGHSAFSGVFMSLSHYPLQKLYLSRKLFC